MSCDNLVSLEEKDYDEDSNLQISSLRTLSIGNCNNMERCSCSDSIENLSVDTCRSITSISLPTGAGGGLKSLEIWYCDKLLEKELGVQNNNIRSSIPMLLEYVHIREWPNLKSIINLKCLVHLTQLKIVNCEGGLKKPISKWGSQNFPTSLVELSLYDGGEDGVGSCSQISNLLPSTLTSLELVDFEKLESFSMGLQHLQILTFVNCPNLHKSSHTQHLTNSLQHLTFDECPNTKDLPEQLLPSLLSFGIWDNCPERKMQQRRELPAPSLPYPTYHHHIKSSIRRSRFRRVV
ncbi:hypothetical protein R6Q57_006928 [Mikania cordata]